MSAPPLSTVAPAPVRAARGHPRLVHGFCGGLLGGLIAGLLGGALAPAIEAIDLPGWGEAVHGALWGVLTWTGLGAVAGLALGRVALALRRRTFLLTLLVVFWATLVGAIEAAQHGAASAAAAYALAVVLFGVVGLVLVPAVKLLWRLRLVVAAWLAICAAGAVVQAFWPAPFTPVREQPEERVVQMWKTPLPAGLGVISEHHWFLEYDPEAETWHRWELMEEKDLGGTGWGHVYRDLYRPYRTFGGGPAAFVREWRGPQADALSEALARSPEYPYRQRYIAWPGPNCNTYAAWVLRQAGVSSPMGPKAIGQDYFGVAGAGVTPGGTGVQAETASVGVKVGVVEGAQLHLGEVVFGVDVWTPGLLTPLGRLGFPK